MQPLSGVPSYQQLADLIKTQIESGELRPGDKLPTVVALMERYQVARDTVRAAMIQLKAQGLIVGRQGVGVFVTDRQA